MLAALKSPNEMVILDRQGQWFCRGDRFVDVSTRRVPSTLVSALLEARRQDAELGLPQDELIKRLWPDAALVADSAKNRLHFTLSTLRKMGLDSVIERVGSSYRLNRALRIVVTP